MVYAVGSTQPSDITRRQIDKELKPLIEQIDGVAAVEINGGELREIQVNLDPWRLEALQLPIQEVTARLAAANLDVPSKVLTVTYNPTKITPEAIRTDVQKTGYDADQAKADARSYERLPECCKKTAATH